MEVVAIKVGFHGGTLRQVGDKFDVPKGTKASWFAPTSGEGAVEVAAPKAKKPEPKALSELAPKGKTFNEVHGENLA